MNMFRRRKLRKTAEHLLHAAHHARHMREDIAPAAAQQELAAAEAALKAALAAGDEVAFEGAAERLGAATRAVYPPGPAPVVREYLEIIVVALTVAMAFRCYFIQPFRIPTGSMQPTLFGVQVTPQDAPTWRDAFPIRWIRWALFGTSYVEVKARCSGVVSIPGPAADPRQNGDRDFYAIYVGAQRHPVRTLMPPCVRPGQYVQAGDVLARGRVTIGDHVFVNKVRYNFSRPRRGDVIVFSVASLRDPRILKSDFYIKRLAGLPGETLRIAERHLVADGRPVESPEPFHRLTHDPRYVGYTNVGGFGTPWAQHTLRASEFLPLGDNTEHSYDGRYFGPVPLKDLVGPGFFVYWPISERWGAVR